VVMRQGNPPALGSAKVAVPPNRAFIPSRRARVTAPAARHKTLVPRRWRTSVARSSSVKGLSMRSTLLAAARDPRGHRVRIMARNGRAA
jgi:hypothetical protein